MAKNQLRTDYHSLKKKYLARKSEWEDQLKRVEHKSNDKRDSLVNELQKQIQYYKVQADSMN